MLYPREILAKITPFLDKNIIILLIGSRQIGKTSIMRLIQQETKQRKLAQKNQILFFDLESIDDLSRFQEKTYQQLGQYFYQRAGLPETKKLYVFVDEIQYLKNSSSLFKLIADHYPQIHLILSGSSSLEIKKIFSERLTGRKILFNIRPLSFREYLIFCQHPLKHLLVKIKPKEIFLGKLKNIWAKKDFIAELLPAYEEFVIYGSYPRPSLKENHNIRLKLLEEIRDTYVRKDISDILRVKNLSGFNRLLQLLATQSGNLVNLTELANSSNLDKTTLEHYLFLMQKTYILSLIPPYYSNRRKEIIKMPKVYFNDTGIRNALLDIFQSLPNRPDKGALVENAVFNQLQYLDKPIKFWRTKTRIEVDFIILSAEGQIIPAEVKYQNFRQPQIPSGLQSFINTYQPPMAFVITKDFLFQSKLNQTNIYFVPALFF